MTGIEKKVSRKSERRRLVFSRETRIVMLLLDLKCGCVKNEQSACPREDFINGNQGN
jgi:hypothetical protein